ncbi:RNA polymerase recycling motor HelD [Paenibacillus radicis (ex Xue et al. 2023)]|uniref:UvrD-helicase domain-containing protein n=1 Tax=Paenibacillus radicis (ex Xue et al. 2023) TaxID=2972489 RepID=A0ABT1YIX9_9BACL|nr:RNA polymerase recycling motor HelD [Paenibacillus radicis (ex Xue et al. 2023)]MCR8632233.1 UvrD-helicase domain-containing protein [Paenibacillus radicis (ex Xue et al. 2023)]
MTMHDRAWNEEEQRLRRVAGLIKTRVNEVGQLAEQRLETAIDTNRDFWADITVNMNNPDEIMETYTSINQQSMVMVNQERDLLHAEDTLKQLLRLHDTPYFGRIDFTESGYQDTESIYIGTSSFFDEATQQYWIYDWRAPISNLFYDFPPGPASYKTPGGQIDGTVELKRQYVIRQGEMKAMFDTGITIGDEILQTMLGQNADDRMKSIVATIQKEQNQIIRDDRHQVLIVQGAAGSGKTSVALQRVAYLMYKHRNTLNADNMVLFSPNDLFNSYISTVLPELGETNMQQTTYQQYLQYRLGSRYNVEDQYTQMEYRLTARNDPAYAIRQSGIQFKSSHAFIRIMDSYAQHLEQADMIFKDLRFRGKVLISQQQLSDYFYGIDPSIKLSNRVQLMKDWLLKELKALAKAERTEAWVKEAMELLDKDEYQKAFSTMEERNTDQEQLFYDAKQEAFLLSRYVVHQNFQPLRRKIKKLKFINIHALYKQLFQEHSRSLLESIEGTLLPADWEAICLQTVAQLDNQQLAFEDATPLLYLNELIEGFQSYNTVRHVIIDEAQDYSAFQFTFLKRLFPRSKMTLLGDMNQAIYTNSTVTSESNEKNNVDTPSNPHGYNHVIELFGAGQTDIIRLVRSYRSTREIVEFTKAMLPNGEAIEPFNRNGEKPLVLRATDINSLTASVIADLNALQAEGIQSIAILTKTAEESRVAYERLFPSIPVALITKNDHSFEKGILIMPAYLAKGLEFDAVLLWNASHSQYDQESERKLFYTACTRAMHRLHIFYIDELTRFILALNAHAYNHSETY